MPLSELLVNPSAHTGKIDCQTVVVCRLGNDSQIAVEALRETVDDEAKKDLIVDLVGGLRRWSQVVDTNFPVY